MADAKKTSTKEPKQKAQGAAKAQGTAKEQRAAQPRRRTLSRASPRRRRLARLREIYKKEIVPALTKQFGYKSVMQVPRVSKVVLNMGVGEAVGDKKLLENAVGDMTKISGQKPVVTKARKAIAAFKIREGYPIGCMVTLRENRMYEFLDRLISVALPRGARLPRRRRAARSTAAATSTWASRNRSSFPRSSTTRSTRCAG
jgi:hypothetical protein